MKSHTDNRRFRDSGFIEANGKTYELHAEIEKELMARLDLLAGEGSSAIVLGEIESRNFEALTSKLALHSPERAKQLSKPKLAQTIPALSLAIETAEAKAAAKPPAAAPAVPPAVPGASAPAVAPANPAPPDGAALYAEYEKLKGGAKSAFFQKHEAALMAHGKSLENAAQVPQRAGNAPSSTEIDAARKLLADYAALNGREKSAFFRENHAALTKAAKLIETA